MTEAMAPASPWGIRDAVMGLYDVVRLSYGLFPDWHDLFEAATLIRYGLDHPSTTRRYPMDVSALTSKWLEAIVVLATAHDKATLDATEYDVETLMAPLLVAPVRQLREFYTRLVATLKADPRVPLFVWATFDAWGEVKVKNAPDQAVRELKSALAHEIADLVDQDIAPDIGKAIAAALRWRDPETLEQVRDAVKAGAKPKLTGKESCLFLEVAGHTVML